MKIDVFQRMHQGVIALDAAEDFDGAVGDNFIDVHVGGCSGPALKSVDGELIGKLSGGCFVACFFYRVGFFGRQITILGVGLCAGFFDLGQRPDERWIDFLRADAEIVHRPLGMNPPVRLLRNIQFA